MESESAGQLVQQHLRTVNTRRIIQVNVRADRELGASGAARRSHAVRRAARADEAVLHQVTAA
jgi:hypothetical protein